MKQSIILLAGIIGLSLIGIFVVAKLILDNLNKDKNKSLDDILVANKDKNNEIKQIILQIENKEIVDNSKEITEIITKIIDKVESNLQKYNKVNNFLEQYIMLTIDILDKYSKIEKQKTDANIALMDSSKKAIEEINEVLKKQLLNLYQFDIVDVDAEIEVFEDILNADGFSQDNDFGNIK